MFSEKKVRKKRNADYYVYRNKNNQATDEELLKTHLEKFRAGGPSILRRRIKVLQISKQFLIIFKTDKRRTVSFTKLHKKETTKAV